MTGGRLLAQDCQPIHTLACPSPASLPAQARPDGGTREMQLSCTLLVYFEKPLVSFPAWGRMVAAGLCSQDGLRAGPCPSFTPCYQPFPSVWPELCEPPYPGSQLRDITPTWQGQRSGTQSGLSVGAGNLSAILREWGAELAPHCPGPAPASSGPTSAEPCPRRRSASSVTQQQLWLG